MIAFVGSGTRPIGNWLADKVGGGRLLSFLLFGISLTYFAAAPLPALTAMVVILMFWMVCLGVGNGAVFQLMLQRFRQEIGLATGISGAIGGVGGFFLPTLLDNR